jgi:hypothetical protein
VVQTSTILPVSTEATVTDNGNGALAYAGGYAFTGVSRAGLSTGLRYELAFPLLQMPFALGLGVEYGLTSVKYQGSIVNSVLGWWSLPLDVLARGSTYGCVNLGFRWTVLRR